MFLISTRVSTRVSLLLPLFLSPLLRWKFGPSLRSLPKKGVSEVFLGLDDRDTYTWNLEVSVV